MRLPSCPMLKRFEEHMAFTTYLWRSGQRIPNQWIMQLQIRYARFPALHQLWRWSSLKNKVARARSGGFFLPIFCPYSLYFIKDDSWACGNGYPARWSHYDIIIIIFKQERHTGSCDSREPYCHENVQLHCL